jgi:signal transduction histidine kinase
MSPIPASGSPEAGEPNRERDWLSLGAFAFAFVIAALVALVIAPAVLLQRMSMANREVSTAILPANDAVMELAFAMERRIASSRGRFLTGDPRYDAGLAEARAAEADALRRIEIFAPRLVPAAADNVTALRGHIARRDSLESALIQAGGGVAEYLDEAPRFEALRDSVQMELSGLRGNLLRATSARFAAEARWADHQRALSSVLGPIGLIAALVVGWSAWTQRRLRQAVQRSLKEANRLREIAERRGDELRRVSESRVRLINGITHDVKNPLAAAKGFAELLEMEIRAPMLPEQAPLVAGVKRSVDRALAIIGDMLDLARVNGGGLAMRFVTVDVAEVVRGPAEDLRSMAEAVGHTLQVHLPPRPLTVCTDPSRAGQVLGNLISNAIKYTPAPGLIMIDAGVRHRTATLPDERWAAITVTDSGPGIPADQRLAIFDEFTRLDEDSEQHGHGLGLAIARRMAHLLGGDLTLDHTEGSGSTFVLWLPERQPSALPAPDAALISAGAAGGRSR